MVWKYLEKSKKNIQLDFLLSKICIFISAESEKGNGFGSITWIWVKGPISNMDLYWVENRTLKNRRTHKCDKDERSINFMWCRFFCNLIGQRITMPSSLLCQIRMLNGLRTSQIGWLGRTIDVFYLFCICGSFFFLPK